MDANLVYGENLVDEDGDRLLINSTSITSGFIDLEDGFGQIIMEHPDDLPAPRQIKFLLEDLLVPPLKSNENAFIVLDSDIEYEDTLVLNATDNLGTNSGDKIIPNSTAANGVGDPTNNIVLKSGITDSVNEKLLYENDVPFTNLLLDGTNADTLHINEKVLFEDAGIDFSAGTTSIATASGLQQLFMQMLQNQNLIWVLLLKKQEDLVVLKI